MKKINIFIISILLGLVSNSVFAFPVTAVEKNDTKKDYEKFNTDMNKELKKVDAQIKGLDKEVSKTELTKIHAKRNEIDKDLYNLKYREDPYYSELKYDIEQEHKMLRNDIDKISEPQRIPASK